MAARKKPAATAADAAVEQPAPPVAPVAVCVIDGCDRPVLHRGLCEGH